MNAKENRKNKIHKILCFTFTDFLTNEGTSFHKDPRSKIYIVIRFDFLNNDTVRNNETHHTTFDFLCTCYKLQTNRLFIWSEQRLVFQIGQRIKFPVKGSHEEVIAFTINFHQHYQFSAVAHHICLCCKYSVDGNFFFIQILAFQSFNILKFVTRGVIICRTYLLEFSSQHKYFINISMNHFLL